jgi:hypothetical protein
MIGLCKRPEDRTTQNAAPRAEIVGDILSTIGYLPALVTERPTMREYHTPLHVYYIRYVESRNTHVVIVDLDVESAEVITFLQHLISDLGFEVTGETREDDLHHGRLYVYFTPLSV